MRKIVCVDLENFQKHRHAHFDFSDFTAIVGPTNVGKSAIIRAIVWCLYNTPSGTKFITKKAEDPCVVSILFDDGLKIIRERGKTVNSYTISIPKNEDIVLKDFGVGPVYEVVQAHGMREVDFLDESQTLNICKQLSPPFFLGESPTSKGLIIGKLGKTDVIDASIKNVSSEIRYKKAAIKAEKEKLTSVKAELSGLKGLSIKEKDLDKAKIAVEKIDYLTSKINNINSSLKTYEKLTDKKKELIRKISSAGDIDEAIKLVDEAINISTQFNSIQKELNKLNKLLKEKEILKEKVEKASLDEVDDTIKNVAIIFDKIATFKNIEKNIKILEDLNEESVQLKSMPLESEVFEALKTVENSISMLQKYNSILPINRKFLDLSERKASTERKIVSSKLSHKNCADKYKELLKEEHICPVCMSEITEEQIDNISELI